ncbi:hypothetical protein ONZ45_g12598 [Pleurotus djamor]|nr:hypothetical protein ONZ45_g12598 [Pleurotus djamor]
MPNDETINAMDIDHHDMAQPEDQPHEGDLQTVHIVASPKSQIQGMYIREFVQHKEEFIKAIFEKEALPSTKYECGGRCLRDRHWSNPLHRVKKWTGSYFREANLAEVGVHLLAPHEHGQLCGHLLEMKMQIEANEEKVDDFERKGQTWKEGKRVGVDADDVEMQGGVDDTGLDDEIDGDNGEWESFPSADDAADEAEDEEGAEDEEEEEEEEESMMAGETPGDNGPESMGPRGPGGYIYAYGPGTGKVSSLGLPVVTIVHLNGHHHLAVVTCQTCSRAQSDAESLLRLGFMASTYKRITTLFTCSLLDEVRIASIEANVSVYQYHKILQRRTCPTAPSSVPSCYPQLRRLARCWRWLKQQKWSAWSVMDDTKSMAECADCGAGRPATAPFCMVCPQVGLNVGDEWKTDPNQWVYKRSIMADGNFKADHLRRVDGDGDEWLGEGTAMFAKREDYKRWLEKAIEKKTNESCESRFYAVENSNVQSKVCDITGIVAIACPRHGAFVPGAAADLYRGEQQKNVDWTVLQAFQNGNFNADQPLLMFYDIACQYSVHFWDRMRAHLPTLSVDFAVGQFHVHGHQNQCLYRYSSSYIPETGVVVGEILESLWSDLNGISTSMRTATPATRAELLGDHMLDSNHKKMSSMPASICARWRETLARLEAIEDTLHKHIAAIHADLLARWTAEVEAAEKARHTDLKRMDVYATQIPTQHIPGPQLPEEPISGMDSWLEAGIKLEEKMIQLAFNRRRQVGGPRSDQLEAIEAQIKSQLRLWLAKRDEYGAELSDIFQTQGEADPTAPPIGTTVPLPSRVTRASPALKSRELSLRLKQAAQLVSDLRGLVADQSFQFVHVLRGERKTKKRALTRKAISEIQFHLKYLAHVYQECRVALRNLGAEPQVFDTYRVLEEAHLKASTAVLDPNATGSTRPTTSWLWFVGQVDPSAPESIQEYNRVHFLRARASQKRWSEERLLLQYEMKWLVTFLRNRRDQWARRVRSPDVVITTTMDLHLLPMNVPETSLLTFGPFPTVIHPQLILDYAEFRFIAMLPFLYDEPDEDFGTSAGRLLLKEMEYILGVIGLCQVHGTTLRPGVATRLLARGMNSTIDPRGVGLLLQQVAALTERAGLSDLRPPAHPLNWWEDDEIRALSLQELHFEASSTRLCAVTATFCVAMWAKGLNVQNTPGSTNADAVAAVQAARIEEWSDARCMEETGKNDALRKAWDAEDDVSELRDPPCGKCSRSARVLQELLLSTEELRDRVALARTMASRASSGFLQVLESLQTKVPDPKVAGTSADDFEPHPEILELLRAKPQKSKNPLVNLSAAIARMNLRTQPVQMDDGAATPTYEEVLAMLKPQDERDGESHQGYVLSLPFGNQRGRDDLYSTPTLPAGAMPPDDVSPHEVPPTPEFWHRWRGNASRYFIPIHGDTPSNWPDYLPERSAFEYRDLFELDLAPGIPPRTQMFRRIKPWNWEEVRQTRQVYTRSPFRDQHNLDAAFRYEPGAEGDFLPPPFSPATKAQSLGLPAPQNALGLDFPSQSSQHGMFPILELILLLTQHASTACARLAADIRNPRNIPRAGNYYSVSPSKGSDKKPL